MRISENLGMHPVGAVVRPAALVTHAHTQAAPQPTDALHLGQAAPLQEAPEAPPQRPPQRFVAVSASGVETLPTRADGGVLVERETGTVAYTGAAARAFLSESRLFDKETEIVIPDGASASVTIAGETCQVDESAIVLIPAGATARVQVLHQDPLIIQTERAPSWYRKHTPATPFYDEIAARNQQIVDGQTILRAAFPQSLLPKLESQGVVRDEGKRVRWADFRTPDALRERLDGLTQVEKELTERLWSDTVRRRLFGNSAGRVARNTFREQDVDRLVDAGLVVPMRLSPQDLRWSKYVAEPELRERLHAVGFRGADSERVVDVWRQTSHAGYDISGMNWQKEGVILYTHRGRLNMWSETPTEWLVASTSFAAKEPFTVGVSTVRAADRSEPIPFRDIRPAESLHSHPVSDGATQTEAYLVSKGKGALLTVQDGKPVLEILHEGDMAVLQPGVRHAVLAVDGDYEQLVFQVPSTFQYGFRFKESHEYSDLGMSYETILETARRELAKGTRGTVPVTPPAEGRSPDVLVEGL